MVQKPLICNEIRSVFQASAVVTEPPASWIGTDGDFYPNRIDRNGKQWPILAIVYHIMQGTLAGTDSHFNNPRVDASTHFGIGSDGTIHQYVDLKDGAWGNGLVQKGTWALLKQYPGVNPNLYTVSIEFEGMHQGNTFWTPTEAQVKAAIELSAWLCQEYQIPPDRTHMVGHYEIDAVDRPNDPGPNFPFDRVVNEVAAMLKSTFTDMNGHWAKDIVEELAQRRTPTGEPLLTGIANGDGSFRFEPDKPLTRAQAAVLIKRLLTIIDAK